MDIYDYFSATTGCSRNHLSCVGARIVAIWNSSINLLYGAFALCNSVHKDGPKSRYRSIQQSTASLTLPAILGHMVNTTRIHIYQHHNSQYKSHPLHSIVHQIPHRFVFRCPGPFGSIRIGSSAILSIDVRYCHIF